MTCLYITPTAPGQAPALLMLAWPLTPRAFEDFSQERTANPSLSFALPGGLGIAAAAPAEQGDEAAEIEYASWLPDPGDIEYASWRALLQPSAS